MSTGGHRSSRGGWCGWAWPWRARVGVCVLVPGPIGGGGGRELTSAGDPFRERPNLYLSDSAVSCWASRALRDDQISSSRPTGSPDGLPRELPGGATDGTPKGLPRMPQTGKSPSIPGWAAVVRIPLGAEISRSTFWVPTDLSIFPTPILPAGCRASTRPTKPRAAALRDS